MRFLFLSEAGDGLGFAVRVKEEGNEVLFWTKEKRFAGHNGLVDPVLSVEAGLSKKPHAIIVDSSGMGAMCDGLLKRGFKVFGGGSINDKMETDRDFAMKLVEETGIQTPPYKTFAKRAVQDARNMIKKTKKRYVFKPKGDGWANLTYVAKDADDMMGFLDYIEKSGAVKGDFLLQEFVEGIELSTNLHFHKGVPIFPSDQTMELKKFMNGDLGPNTGCMASTVWANSSRSPKTVKETFEKLYKWLRKVEYTGPLDINAIVNEKGVWFLEFTPRFGYNAHYCWASLLDGELGRNFAHLAMGTATDLEYAHRVSFGLRLTTPPYPLDPYEPKNWPAYDESAGHVILDYPEKHTYFLDVKMKDGQLLTAGTDGANLEIVYAGQDLEKCAKLAYDAAKAVKLPDKQYRTDGIERVLKQCPELKKLGYEVPL